MNGGRVDGRDPWKGKLFPQEPVWGAVGRGGTVWFLAPPASAAPAGPSSREEVTCILALERIATKCKIK